MKKLSNVVLFQAAWFVGVSAAARGEIWIGPAAMLVVVLVHLWLVPDRVRELRFLIAVGALGTIVDTVLAMSGVITWPTSHATWSSPIAPPWDTALWIGFATLPRFSLAWLARRPLLAALFGAVGGPLSYFAGVRLGAVATGAYPYLTWSLLAMEYALVTPLLLHWAPGLASRAASSTAAIPRSAR